MSQYIENNLGKDEKIILKARKSILYLIVPIIWLVIVIALAIVANVQLGKFADDNTSNIITRGTTYLVWAIWSFALLIGLIPFLKRLFTYLSINLAVTNKRVVGKVGLISIHTIDIHIDKIDHVGVTAGVFGNILHYYGLNVFSVGGAGYDNRNEQKDLFVGISNAQAFKDTVTRAIETHADEARKAQAEEIARAMGGRQVDVAHAINDNI